jgi:hypothetical protein
MISNKLCCQSLKTQVNSNEMCVCVCFFFLLQLGPLFHILYKFRKFLVWETVADVLSPLWDGLIKFFQLFWKLNTTQGVSPWDLNGEKWSEWVGLSPNSLNLFSKFEKGILPQPPVPHCVTCRSWHLPCTADRQIQHESMYAKQLDTQQ